MLRINLPNGIIGVFPYVRGFVLNTAGTIDIVGNIGLVTMTDATFEKSEDMEKVLNVISFVSTKHLKKRPDTLLIMLPTEVKKVVTYTREFRERAFTSFVETKIPKERPMIFLGCTDDAYTYAAIDKNIITFSGEFEKIEWVFEMDIEALEFFLKNVVTNTTTTLNLMDKSA